MYVMSRNILGVKVDFLSKSDVLEKVDALLDTGRNMGEEGTVDRLSVDNGEVSVDLVGKEGGSVEWPANTNLLCTTNPEFVMSAQKDPEFKDLINESFLSVPDGVGMLYANYYLKNLQKGNLIGDFFRGLLFGLTVPFSGENSEIKKNLGERIAGVSLVYDLCALAERKNYSVFLLGGWPTDFFGHPLRAPGYDLAQEAGAVLKKLYPDLNLVGATSALSCEKGDDEKTVKFVQSALKARGLDKLDILIVCYGQKNQEKWIARNGPKIPVTLGIGAGGSFDYISGTKAWAPKWIRKIHLEWLFRLVTQPWRLKRVFTAFPIFPLKVFLSSR